MFAELIKASTIPMPKKADKPRVKPKKK